MLAIKSVRGVMCDSASLSKTNQHGDISWHVVILGKTVLTEKGLIGKSSVALDFLLDLDVGTGYMCELKT